MKRLRGKLQQALDLAGLTSLHCIADLGFVGWRPPPVTRAKKRAPYQYKSLATATVEEIKSFTVSNAAPDSILDVYVCLPFAVKNDLPKQVFATRFPYGQIAVVAPLCHAHSRFDLSTLDFFFGCSALEILSAARKTGKTDRAPYYLMTRVPRTKTIMLHYNLNFGQVYNVPGFQFERLMTRKRVEDCPQSRVYRVCASHGDWGLPSSDDGRSRRS